MTQTVSAQDARNRFSEVLNTAAYGWTKVVITRFDKPQAVIMSYAEYEKLMNPKNRFTDREWDEGFGVFDRIRAKNRGMSTAKIEKGVEEAVREVRRKKSVQGRS